MKTNLLKNLINRLIEVEPDQSPLISCFVNLDQPRSNYFSEIEPQARLISKQLAGDRACCYEDSLAEIRDYLESSLKPASKSVAIYSRWGEFPVFVPVQFEAPLKTQFIVDDLPHIYPLIELKDTYHRFVIVIVTEETVRILETAVGSVTEEILATRPDLRQRIGREWTREHYRNHKHEREQRFIREKIQIVDKLMSRRDHSHLVVAGSPKMVSRLTNALPTRLKQKLINTVATNPKSGIDPILVESIHLFAAAENIESHDRVRLLESAVFGGGLGVAGYDACLAALTGGYADLLIVDQDYGEPEGREELVRLATTGGVQIETVNRSETLQRLAGVGCLLRYQPNPDDAALLRSAA